MVKHLQQKYIEGGNSLPTSRPASGRREVVVSKHMARVQRDQGRLKKIREREIPGIISGIRLLGSSKREEDEAERQRLQAARALLQSEEKQLEESLVQSDLPCGSSDEVAVGSTVTFVILRSGVEHTLTIISNNGRPKEDGTISIGTPVGKALMGAKVGDEIETNLPGGVVGRLRVTEICSG